jgi:hypothetical protein
MQRATIFGLGSVAALAVGAGAFLQQYRTPSVADHRALLDRYCVTCHNDLEFAGEVAFDSLQADHLHANAAIWETTIRKLRGHLMPPPGEPRPADNQVESFAAWLERSSPLPRARPRTPERPCCIA